jgi:Core-2/I-Branching enzyme
MSRLSADWSHCFVHVDKKVDIRPFHDANSSENVTFLPMSHRVSVNWCGYSTSVAILNLLRFAAASPSHPSRFVLLSGVDYPVQSIDCIGPALWEDKEFIQIDREIDPTGVSQYDLCLNRRFLGDSRLLNPRTAQHVVNRIARALERRMVRRHPKGLRVFYGPTWWTLTREAALDVLAYVDENPSIARWFSGAQVPDESMFHTILKASSRSARIAFDATRPGEPPFGLNRHALHYIDWTVGNPSLPKTLELSDLNAILESGALFARKMSSSQSAGLLDALDAACER